MPSELRKAHAAIDVYVDRLYRQTSFSGWDDRVKMLLDLHEARELQPAD
ncbi:type IIL restriction-modification enzyme MmeI [Frondihabitans sp. PAMC 28766]